MKAQVLMDFIIKCTISKEELVAKKLEEAQKILGRYYIWMELQISKEARLDLSI